MSRIIWIVTTSIHVYSEQKPMTPIVDESVLEERTQQYRLGIQKVLSYKKPDEICIITENNGLQESFLDEFVTDNVFVHYTDNQFLPSSSNKGRKELLDIQSCIKDPKYDIDENDLIIKVTGRYELLSDEFIECIRSSKDDYDVFFRAGSMFKHEQSYHERSMTDCVLGLIALRSRFFVETMNVNDIVEYSPVEWIYSRNIQQTIPSDRQYVADILHLRNADRYM